MTLSSSISAATRAVSSGPSAFSAILAPMAAGTAEAAAAARAKAGGRPPAGGRRPGGAACAGPSASTPPARRAARDRWPGSGRVSPPPRASAARRSSQQHLAQQGPERAGGHAQRGRHESSSAAALAGSGLAHGQLELLERGRRQRGQSLRRAPRLRAATVRARASGDWRFTGPCPWSGARRSSAPRGPPLRTWPSGRPTARPGADIGRRRSMAWAISGQRSDGMPVGLEGLHDVVHEQPHEGPGDRARAVAHLAHHRQGVVQRHAECVSSSATSSREGAEPRSGPRPAG